MPEKSFEERMRELEEVLRRLERGDLTLDESVSEYSRGVEALKACREILGAAEKRIEQIVETDKGMELRPVAPPAS